jgi:TRAP-type mannitol/chloroaromatic compound transport system permease small subunit
VLYILFLFPGALALIWYGYHFAADSWFYKEVSWSSPSRIQIYFFKTLIPISGVLVFLQGFAEAVRCIICIRTGEWPPRLHDVQETETMLMNEQADLRKIEEESRHV